MAAAAAVCRLFGETFVSAPSATGGAGHLASRWFHVGRPFDLQAGLQLCCVVAETGRRAPFGRTTAPQQAHMIAVVGSGRPCSWSVLHRGPRRRTTGEAVGWLGCVAFDCGPISIDGLWRDGLLLLLLSL